MFLIQSALNMEASSRFLNQNLIDRHKDSLKKVEGPANKDDLFDSISRSLKKNKASVVSHYYVDPSNIVTRPFHWDQTEETKRDTNWHDLKQRGRKRLNAIVENNLEGVYALGQAKNLDDYSLFSGLDIKNKQVLDPGNVFNFNKLKDLKWNQDSEKTGIFG